jgi:hypothetical protein
MIRRVWWLAYLIVTFAVIPTGGWAQNFGGSPSMRVQWEADSPRNGLQAVCGRVFNDHRVTAVRVRLQVEGLDASGLVINSRATEVLGEVRSEGNAFFCVPVQAGVTTYRVTVSGADWMFDSGE